MWIDAKIRLPEPYATVYIRLVTGLKVFGYRHPSAEWCNNYDVIHWKV